MVVLPVENLLQARARLGECPVWDEAAQALYWVDIYNHRVHRFTPSTGEALAFDVDGVVSAVALVGSERLLLALRNELAFLDVRSGSLRSLHRVEFSRVDTRFNDGKCDRMGRFWIGSISKVPREAALYRFDPDGSFRVMERELTISNGLGWSPDGGTFYLTDSPERKIYAYDFDERTGDLSRRRVLVDLGREAPGVEPDGLAVDLQGNIWSALWDGWCVARFDARGNELARIALPVQRPTSVCFGGPRLDELYVTSASVGLSQDEIEQGHFAGDLLRIRPGEGARGVPGNTFATRRS